MKIRLHTRYQNSAGQRVRTVLHLKQVDFEYVPITDSALYRRINPQGLMPALEIDGRVVAQSMAIIDLLEDLFPEPPVYPTEPVRRAEVRSFCHLITSDLHPLNNRRVRNYLSDRIGADPESIDGWYAHWCGEAFTSLEVQLAADAGYGPFCFGASPTVADACLVPQFDNARRFDIDLSAFPRLLAADAACRQLEAFRLAATEAQSDYPG